MAQQKLKLSILDQSIVRKGGTATQAVAETIATAKMAEKLGYYRFWVSEHHNSSMIAGSAPEVLMVKLADETSSIRIGSGGIMLPNHSALKVAENFRMLETLFPGRIDLGMGRAPGGDRLTASLLNPSNTFSEEAFSPSWIIYRPTFVMRRLRSMVRCWRCRRAPAYRSSGYWAAVPVAAAS